MTHSTDPRKRPAGFPLRLSLAQLNPTTGDLEGNAALILEAMDRARQEGYDLVATPELCLTGYCLDEKLLINPTFLDENRRILEEVLLPASQGIAVIVGFIDFDRTRRGPDGHRVRFNAAAVLQDRKLLQVVHKRLLPAYRYFEDKRYFEEGREVEPVEIETRDGPVPIGVLICEDLWDEGYQLQPSRIYCEKGARCLISINASPFCASSPGRNDGKRFRRRRLVSKRACELGTPVAYLNTVGIGDNGKNVIVFDGGSFVVDAQGASLLEIEPFEEGQEGTGPAAGPPSEDPGSYDREAELFAGLVLGLREYDRKIGAFESVLQPVSGGIDSALGTALAFEAFGAQRLVLYNLPTRFNSARTRELARELAGNFGLRYKVFPIDDLVHRFGEGFEKHLHPFQRQVTLENIQSRIRGLVMMAESNDSNALLISNGNETEIALGYATLYGDMAGGISPLGDLSKPDVFRLAEYVNRRWGREMIPGGIIEAVPSAELSEGQTDPFDYDLVGPIVSDLVERGGSPGQLARLFVERRLDEAHYPHDLYARIEAEDFRQLAENLFRAVNRSVYKRLQGPPIIVVSERAFGFDLRETLINAWKERHPAQEAVE